MEDTIFSDLSLKLRHGEEFLILWAAYDGIHIVWYLTRSDSEGNMIEDDDTDDLGFGRFQVEIEWRLEECLEKLGVAKAVINAFKIWGYGTIKLFEQTVPLAILDQPVPSSQPTTD